MRFVSLITLLAVSLLVDTALGQLAAPITSPTYVEPPPPRQEAITVAPSSQAVWVAGAWERTPDQWIWVDGRWTNPPFRRAYWTPGYWQHAGGEYRWLPGHWATGPQGAVVTQKVTPPAPIVETQPAPTAATANLAWAPGHWEWRGTWVWIPGQYVSVSNSQAVWVPGEWDPAENGAWRWNPAHWAMK